MARARNIKPGFFMNEELVELPFETRLLFIGLWTIADRAGRLEDKPKRIKMSLFPADNIDADDCLNQLQKSGFIIRYSVDGIQYIQVLAFYKHQNPHKDEKASVIPAPCKHHANTMQAPCKHDDSTVAIVLIPDSLIPDSLNPIPQTPKIESRTSALDDFDEFWKRYPKKVGKDKALISWQKKRPRPDDVMFALSWQTESEQWTKNDGQFIPNPATYLNEGRWQDEKPVEVTF